MIKKVSHIILALLLMVSTMGMTVSMHYCGQKMVDFGVLSEAKSCCDMDQSSTTATTNHHCAVVIPQDNHCQNKTLHVDPVDEYVFAATGYTVDIHPIIQDLLIPVSIACIVNEPKTTSSKYFHWNTPPPTTSHFLSLIQTYLI